VYALVTREKPELCPGEVCEPGARQAIQRVSAGQLAMVVVLVAYVVVVAATFHARFGAPPHALFGG
jgi:hypothetical protein